MVMLAEKELVESEVVREQSPSVVALDSDYDSSSFRQPAGSIGHYYAPRSSGLISELRQSILDRDRSRIEPLVARMRQFQEKDGRLDLALSEVDDSQTSSTDYVSLEYHGVPVAPRTPVDNPETKSGCYYVAWTGGVVDESELVVIDHLRRESQESDLLDHLIVVSPPEFSAVEQAAEGIYSSRLPWTPWEKDPMPIVGPDSEACVLVLIAIIVTTFVVLFTAEGGFGGADVHTKTIDLATDKLRDLPPHPTCQQLWELRRSIIKEAV